MPGNDVEHPLERRSHMLATGLLARKQTILDSLAPRTSRPPFSRQLSKQQALAFWQQHRLDPIGQKVLQRMNPLDIMELDVALAQENERQMMGF